MLKKKIKLTFVKKPKVPTPAVGSSLLGPSSTGKPKKRKIKIIQKAQERTQEQIERDEKWKTSLIDTLHKLKPSFSDLENHLPEPIPLGTVGEYLSDDVNNGYAGIWYGVKILRMKEGFDHETGKPKREYLVQYLGDWEEEDVQGETLQDWVDSHLVRPNPPTSVGTVISEYVRGDQVDVIVDPKNAENEWYSGTVLRNIGEGGYDVELDRGGGTQVHHVLASNHIRPQRMWLGTREKSLLKRSANMWQFKEIPRLQMPPDELKLDKKMSAWDSLDKNDEKDEDFEGNEEDGNNDDDVDDIEDDGWGSNGDGSGSDGDGWGTDEDDDTWVDKPRSNKSATSLGKRKSSTGKRKANVSMFLNGALGARKKSKVKGKSAKLKRMIDNFESQF